MYYLKIIDDPDFSEIYLEVNDNGDVKREIGFNSSGKTIHKCPSDDFKDGTYGAFDLSRFDTSNLKNDISKEDFERLWNKE